METIKSYPIFKSSFLKILLLQKLNIHIYTLSVRTVSIFYLMFFIRHLVAKYILWKQNVASLNMICLILNKLPLKVYFNANSSGNEAYSRSMWRNSTFLIQQKIKDASAAWPLKKCEHWNLKTYLPWIWVKTFLEIVIYNFSEKKHKSFWIYTCFDCFSFPSQHLHVQS